jgi:hypothetical protein
MKRQGNLWDWMISFENLLRAAHAAARGKRFKPGVGRFLFDLERQKRPTVPSPDALDPARVCGWPDRVRCRPSPDHELDRSRAPRQYVSPPDRSIL